MPIMSEQQSPQTSAAPATPESGAQAAAKPRTSWLGRIIIGLLLIVLAFEAVSFLRVKAAEKKLGQALAQAEAANQEVTRESVKGMLDGREPDATRRRKAAVGEELYDIYYFPGILKRRVLCVHYGVRGENDPDDMQRDMMEVMPIVPEEILYEEDAPAE
jgi:hypothetical protein